MYSSFSPFYCVAGIGWKCCRYNRCDYRSNFSRVCPREEAILSLVLLIRRGFAGQEPAPPCAGLCLLIAGTAYQETQYEAAKSDASDHWPRIFMNVIIRKFGCSARVFRRFALPFGQVLSHRFGRLLCFVPEILRGFCEIVGIHGHRLVTLPQSESGTSPHIKQPT